MADVFESVLWLVLRLSFAEAEPLGPKAQVSWNPTSEALSLLTQKKDLRGRNRNPQVYHNPEARPCVARLGTALHNLFWTQGPRFKMVLRPSVRHASRILGADVPQCRKACCMACDDTNDGILFEVSMPDIHKLVGSVENPTVLLQLMVVSCGDCGIQAKEYNRLRCLRAASGHQNAGRSRHRQPQTVLPGPESWDEQGMREL